MVLILGDHVPLDGLQTRGKHSLMAPRTTSLLTHYVIFDQVENFQPYYVFNKRKLTELQIGHTVLKEMLEQEQAKEDAAALAKQREKAVADAAVAKVLFSML